MVLSVYIIMICLDLKLHEKTGHFQYRKTKEELLANIMQKEA